MLQERKFEVRTKLDRANCEVQLLQSQQAAMRAEIDALKHQTQDGSTACLMQQPKTQQQVVLLLMQMFKITLLLLCCATGSE